jgi:hypothetical protein
MTSRPLVVSIESEGLDLLQDALLNAPERVTAATWKASRRAAQLLRPSIALVTPVDTGYLQSNTQVMVADAFTVQYENITPYAPYVEARTGYVETGVERVIGNVEAIYEQAITELAASFGTGE